MPIILATWEVEVGRITFSGQSRQKVCEIPSQPIKLGLMVLTFRPAKHKARCYFKNNQCKKGWGMWLG
jgi:hypothetical protein